MSHRRLAAWLIASGIAAVLAFAGASPVRGPGAGPHEGRAGPDVEKDIAYADGGDERKLDVHRPAREGFATVVFVYGGGWHSGSRKAVAPIGEKLRDLGFGCVLPSHRLSPRDKYPAQIEDVAAAVAWVKGHIAARGGDPDKVFLMGHSSGAQLVLLLAADPKFLAAHRLAPKDIAGVIGLSTPVDLAPRGNGKGFGDVLMAGRGADAFDRDPKMMADASPIRHVSKGLPPVLLIVGTRDFPMLEADARAFVTKATEAGSTASLFVAEGRDHMGVVRSLVDEESAVRERVLAFFAKPRG